MSPKKTLRLALVLGLSFAISPGSAVAQRSLLRSCSVVVSGLPAAGVPSRVCLVTDGVDETDCSAGAGATRVLCYDDGVSWRPIKRSDLLWALDDLEDVDLTGAEADDALVFDGANWIPGSAGSIFWRDPNSCGIGATYLTSGNVWAYGVEGFGSSCQPSPFSPSRLADFQGGTTVLDVVDSGGPVLQAFAPIYLDGGPAIGDLQGNADTATALAANGANCSAGLAPLGVDAGGASEGCFDVATQAELEAAATSPGGSSQQVQVNDGAGGFAGIPYVYNSVNKDLRVPDQHGILFLGQAGNYPMRLYTDNDGVLRISRGAGSTSVFAQMSNAGLGSTTNNDGHLGWGGTWIAHGFTGSADRLRTGMMLGAYGGAALADDNLSASSVQVIEAVYDSTAGVPMIRLPKTNNSLPACTSATKAEWGQVWDSDGDLCVCNGVAWEDLNVAGGGSC